MILVTGATGEYGTHAIHSLIEKDVVPSNISALVRSEEKGKALKEKIWSLNLVDLRDFAENGPKSVDDKPYGGGPGMIIKSEVIDNALKKVTKKIKQYSLIYLTPKGKKINQKKIKELVKKDNLIYEEDKILLYKLYQKLKKEFQDIDKSKL